jgi:hypothetical protein
MRASPRAQAIDLSAVRDATDADLARRFHPQYGAALARLPGGTQVFRGLPFAFAGSGAQARWILVDGPKTIDLRGHHPVSHVIVAHLCDAARDPAGGRAPSMPVGYVQPVGEPLARYTVVDRRGRATSRTIRRRFEINEGILGWGSNAFAAVSHRDNEVVDWRGPHPRQPPGRYAAPGQSGLLTILPGMWGAAQTGVSDFVPSASDDALYWLHAIALDVPAEPAELRLEPIGVPGPGRDVALAAITLYAGSSDPLVVGPRFQIVVDGPPGEVETDLGTVIRTMPVPDGIAERLGEPAAAVVGWGGPRSTPRAERSRRQLIDIALSPDAELTVGGWALQGAQLEAGAVLCDPERGTTIEVLPSPSVRREVIVRDAASGRPIPSRVRFTARDGRYLPPVAHRDEINPGLYEDVGADLQLGSSTYAYVPGRFEVDLPVGPVDLEVVAGFERAPHTSSIEVDGSRPPLEIDLAREIDQRADGWVSADAHVHFLAPSTALLQAAAEGINLVNLLATQWGDLFTNVTDLPWGNLADPDGDHLVVLGTENRQNVLGHLGLLGARRPVMPMASAGPPEGRMAGALAALLADWADRCRGAGGLVVAAHFPLPYAEVAADIVLGRIDAVEVQAFAPDLGDPSIVEWYRFLSAGYRLPIVAGTDKMSAEVPVGAVRTYARLERDQPLEFEAWASAIRGGRTFVSSGPVIRLAVEGSEPGEVVHLPATGGRLAVRAEVQATQRVISDVELLVNGRVVAATSARPAGDRLRLEEDLDLTSSAWIAARSRSSEMIESAFASSMAAHTSPVYVEVPDRPLQPDPDDARVIEAVIEGTRSWVAGLAAVADPAERRRMTDVLDDALHTFRRRVERAAPSVQLLVAGGRDGDDRDTHDPGDAARR